MQTGRLRADKSARCAGQHAAPARGPPPPPRAHTPPPIPGHQAAPPPPPLPPGPENRKEGTPEKGGSGHRRCSAGARSLHRPSACLRLRRARAGRPHKLLQVGEIGGLCGVSHMHAPPNLLRHGRVRRTDQSGRGFSARRRPAGQRVEAATRRRSVVWWRGGRGCGGRVMRGWLRPPWHLPAAAPGCVHTLCAHPLCNPVHILALTCRRGRLRAYSVSSAASCGGARVGQGALSAGPRCNGNTPCSAAPLPPPSCTAAAQQVRHPPTNPPTHTHTASSVPPRPHLVLHAGHEMLFVLLLRFRVRPVAAASLAAPLPLDAAAAAARRGALGASLALQEREAREERGARGNKSRRQAGGGGSADQRRWFAGIDVVPRQPPPGPSCIPLSCLSTPYT